MVPTGGLGWTPATFWSASLAEFAEAERALAGDSADAPAITRADARRIALEAGMKLKDD